MEVSEYKNIFENEDSHWWYQSLHNCILSSLRKFMDGGKSMHQILDAGCGAGGVLNAIAVRYPNHNLFGIDLSENALRLCKVRKLDRLYQGTIENLPFENETFDIVISIDVLYHKNVIDDDRAIREFYRILKKGGHLIAQVPAFNFLTSGHDAVVHTVRRYTKSHFQVKLENSGFIVDYCTYRYFFLFPILIFRKIFSIFFKTRGIRSNLKANTSIFNFLLYHFLCFEWYFSKYVKIPVGSSLYC